jgi:hypothetical protein
VQVVQAQPILILVHQLLTQAAVAAADTFRAVLVAVVVQVAAVTAVTQLHQQDQQVQQIAVVAAVVAVTTQQ